MPTTISNTNSPVPVFPSGLSQINWYFDFGNTTGLASDTNSGADSSHPLRTWNGGFVPRAGVNGQGPWAVAPILHFMSTQPSSIADPISFIPTSLPFAIPGGSFAAIIIGTITAKVAAGNLVGAVTSKNRSSPANGQLLTLTFQNGAAGNVAALDFVQNTTGGKVSNSWARTNVGTNEFTMFQPITPAIPGAFPTLAEFDTWAPGDTVQISNIPKVYADAIAGPVFVYNVEISQANVVGVNLNGANLNECRISGGIDAIRTRGASCTNCIIEFQTNRYMSPSLFIVGGGTAGTSGSTVNLGPGSVLTLDAYIGSTGGGPTYIKETTIEAAYIDSGGVINILGVTTLQATDARVAGSPLMWGPGTVDLNGAGEFLILPGNAVASILNQGGAFGCITFAGAGQALFLDTTVTPAVWSGIRNVTAALLDTDGHAGGGFREGVSGGVNCKGNWGGGSIRTGVV